MSDQSTLVTAEHFHYIAERTGGEDDFLRELKRAATAEGIPSIWIAPEQASFMQIVLRLANARDVIEVGTLAGYSAIAMARALPPEGKVRTLELDPQRADFARRWVAKSDVAGKVEVLIGAAGDTLATLADRSADAVFIDADKGNYPLYLTHTLRLLRARGLVMVDNAFAFGELFSPAPTDPEVASVRAFNEHMAGIAELQSVIVPIGDGLWMGVKR